MNINKKASVRAVCSVLAAGSVSFGAHAAIEEVIVTSQHRDQSLQDVSMAVSVISSEIMDDFGIDRIEGLADFTPGLVINTSPGNFTGPAVRGIGTNSGVQTFEQSVGMFVDGVYSGRFRQYQAAVFDVDRVEVVKGGQGTLYGRNSSVGVISLTSRTPGEEFGGYANLEYGTEFGTRVLSAVVDVPLTDNFRVRLALKDLDDPGYVKNVATSQDNPDRDEQALRATAVWDVSENLEAIIRYTAADFDILGNADEVVIDPGNFISAVVDSNPLADGLPNYIKSTRSDFFAEVDQQETEDLSLTLNWSIGEHKLTSITASSELEMTNFYVSSSVDGQPTIPAPAFTTFFDEDFEQFTQEFRLTSPTSDTFEYMVGAFFIDQEYDFLLRLFAGDETVLIPNFSTDVSQKMESWSVFGQGTFHLSDATRFTGSVRYTEEEKDGSLLVLFPEPTDPTSTATNSDTLDDDSVDWSLTLSHDIGDHMVYVNASHSTKSGGIPNNPIGLTELFMAPEEVESFELGLKLAFESGFVNIAIYDMDLADYQLSFFDGFNFQAFSVDGESSGVEVDGLWNLTEKLSLTGSASYSDVNNTDSDPAESGFGFTKAPEWTASLGADYDTSISDRLSLTASLWAVYTDDVFHQPSFAAGLNTQDHTKINARFGVTHEATGIEVALLGQNLTDEKVREFGFPALLGAPGAVIAPLSRPRTLALQINVPF